MINILDSKFELSVAFYLRDVQRSCRVQVVVKIKNADVEMLEAFINQCDGEVVSVQGRARKRRRTATVTSTARTEPSAAAENKQEVQNTQANPTNSGKYCLLCTVLRYCYGAFVS